MTMKVGQTTAHLTCVLEQKLSPALYAAACSGSTDNRIPTVFNTAISVFSVGLPLGDNAR